MDLSSLLTDDQLAVIGCFLALALCGGIGMLSHQFGPAGRGSVQGQQTILPVGRDRQSRDRAEQDRKAA